MRKNSRFLIYLGLVALIFSILVLAYIKRENGFPSGRIVFRLVNQDNLSDLILMNDDGNKIERIGRYFGTPEWSSNGAFLAAGCLSDKKEPQICVLDMASRIDWQREWWHHLKNPEVISRIALSKDCDPMALANPISGLVSLSWSSDNERLAYICVSSNSTDKPNILCVTDLEGHSDCWDPKTITSLMRVSWSPTSEILMISGAENYESEIYFFNLKDLSVVPFAKGWSADWSPDGTQVAFISPSEKDLDGNFDRGIKIINSDGTKERWLYFPESDQGKKLFFICADSMVPCKLSWSPRGNRLAFIAIQSPPYNIPRIYQLDIQTRELVALVDVSIFSSFVADVDWGP